MTLTDQPFFERRCTWLAFPHLFPPMSVSDAPCNIVHDECSIDAGFRYHRYYTERTNISNWGAVYDFITPKPINFFFLSRADLMPDLSGVFIAGSNDNNAFTPVYALGAPFNFTGVREHDLFDCFDDLPAFRYWRIRLTFSVPSRVCFNKFMFGSMFDMGREPDTNFREVLDSERSAVWKTTSSRTCLARTDLPRYVYRLSYTGMKHDEIESFFDEVIQKNKRYAILINRDNEKIINNHEVVHGLIQDIDFQQVNRNWWKLQFFFREMLG